MNDMWKRIFKEYLESYYAIQTLDKNNIIEDEEEVNLKCRLLKDIVCTMESEIEE